MEHANGKIQVQPNLLKTMDPSCQQHILQAGRGVAAIARCTVTIASAHLQFAVQCGYNVDFLLLQVLMIRRLLAKISF
ncbi:hypothetical protein NPIL_152351 [Nephila pilipes]|uniref:Uncharacterized protein n=1 Tax=Nephila pilipes TaxID=299642 RepID=A0A8X6P012_NEPPI|nr:hypothetical protein NPIL_152351 [Nephila pilipes]